MTVEDDERIRTAVKLALEDEGWEVEEADDGEQALEAFNRHPTDVVLIDIMLPGIDGFEVCRSIRRVSDVPIVMVTARVDTHDVVAGLEAGADDYLTKPFALPELEARVRALTRRGTGNPTKIEFGPLTYDQTERSARLDGQAVDLSARELGLLEILVLRAGRLVSKEQLVDHLCGWGEEVSTNAIEVYVHRLRKKLEPGGVRISTVRGLGYCLDRPDGA